MLVRNVPLPPQELIFMDRDPEQGFRMGLHLTDHLRARGANIRDGVFLDIGCGWGRLAFGLLERGFVGRYVGFDILKDRVDWLKQEFSARQNNYEFNHVDVANDRYNKSGGTEDVRLDLMLKNDTAETVTLLSVFTHLYPEDVVNYLHKIRMVVNKDSKLFFTCFIYDGIAETGKKVAAPRFTFPNILNAESRYETASDPLHAIAYTTGFIQSAMKEAGFAGTIFPGSWSGLKAEQVQDWIVARPI